MRQHDSLYRSDVNQQNMPPMEKSCLGLCAEDTMCNPKVNERSEETAMVVSVARREQREITIADSDRSERT